MTLVKSDVEDWYRLEPRTTPLIEGPAEDWQKIAQGIEDGKGASCKRCAVQTWSRDDGRVVVEFWSPRNHSHLGEVVQMSLHEADVLAVNIRQVLEEDDDTDSDPV